MRTTEDLLGRELAAIRAERPDYLITDSVAPWGQWLGEVLGVPVVTSVSTFAFNRRVLAFAVSHGVRPKSAEARALQDPSHLEVDLARAAPEPPAWRQGPRHHRARLRPLGPEHRLHLASLSAVCRDVRRSLSIRRSVGARAPTAGSAVDRELPLVYVSLGTLFNADATFFRNCFEAFRDMDVRVIMSIGSNVSEASLGPAPPNFSVQALRSATGGAPARVASSSRMAA